MTKHQILQSFWKAVALQDKESLSAFFTEDAMIKWHNTNERFSVSEYVRANCEYPGSWIARVKNIEEIHVNRYVTTTHIETTDGTLSFYVNSFFQFSDKKICNLDEYWGDNAEPPQWKKDKNIGQRIFE